METGFWILLCIVAVIGIASMPSLPTVMFLLRFVYSIIQLPQLLTAVTVGVTIPSIDVVRKEAA